MAKSRVVPTLLAGLVLLAGCSPEADCRSGLKQLQPRVEGAIGKGAHAEAVEQINQAYADFTRAEEFAAARDYPACLEKIESARVLLNKSQRN